MHALVEDESRQEVVRRCAVVLREMARHKLGGVFLFPVDQHQFPEYYAVIEEPITVLSLLETLERWSSGEGEAAAAAAAAGGGEDELVDRFTLSVRRMWENCWSYNHEGTKVPFVIALSCLVFFCRGGC